MVGLEGCHRVEAASQGVSRARCRLARSREPGVGLDEIAADYGIRFTTLYSWMKKAEVEDGNRDGPTAVHSAELREAERRIGPCSKRLRSCVGLRLLFADASAGNMSYPLVQVLAEDGIRDGEGAGC